MPLTFFDIERQKNWRIGIFFTVLLFMYFILTILVFQAFIQPFSLLTGGVFRSLFTLLDKGFSMQFIVDFFLFGGDKWFTFSLVAFSLIMASLHFWFSASDAVSSITKNLGAFPPDPDDEIHKRLRNVIEEIHIATGDKRKIDCMVIPTLSMNAMAVTDLKGKAVILITEGLLSRLTRQQLEAVLAHEAYHILSGDCLESTIAASLFGMHSSILERLGEGSEDRPPLFSPAFILAVILLKIGLFLNLFISREREYRADAASVRMTRNPLALAEALYMLSRNWRGAGYIGKGLEMLCIVNPQATELDESEGWWADLRSTHPPIRKRINILLKMAHTSISELEKIVPKKEMPKALEPLYYALDPKHQWQGPFSFLDLAALPWLSPLTWINVSGHDVERAWRNPLMNKIFDERLSHEESEITDFICPHCNQPLIKVSYEKTHIYQCKFCSGILVEDDKISRIIARTEQSCTDRINALARAVIRENQITHTRRMLRPSERKRIPSISCPKCKNPMLRKFYSLAYLIEIDRCGLCEFTWFDADELEMLKCLIVNRIIPDINPSPV